MPVMGLYDQGLLSNGMGLFILSPHSDQQKELPSHLF